MAQNKKPATASNTIEAKCKKCKRDTQHDVLHSEEVNGSTPSVDWYSVEYQVARCKGCENVCFRQSTRTSEDIDEDGQPEEWVTVYPNPSDREPQLVWWKLPNAVGRLYQETLASFNAGAMTLAAAGLRSVVEATCKDQDCTGRDLQKKIEDLVSKGVFLVRDANYLHQHRFLGNEAVHEMESPPKEEFEIALEILEHLLKSIYVLPLRHEALLKMRAKRGAKVS
jgi:hypothetical protein